MTDQPTVVITGASAGIGFAVLQALADEAFTISVSRTPPQFAIPRGAWIKGDLRDAEPVAAMIVQQLHDAGRSLDGVIHCAGSYGSNQRHTLLDTSQDEWDELMSVNVRCQFCLTLHLLPLLLCRPRAFMVGITSDAASRPAPHRIAYACSKAASHAMFAGLAEELAGTEVSVIELLPERQVVTRGIRRRRPQDFVFTGYSSPAIFSGPIRAIVRMRGQGMNGKSLVVA